MNRSIFLIDDDPIINFMNKKIVGPVASEFPVEAFESGEEALERLLQNGRGSYLIFLDLNMPGMSGWDFLNELREKLPSLDVDVVILTSSIDRSDRDKAFTFPLVRHFISKPLTRSRVKEIVGECLSG